LFRISFAGLGKMEHRHLAFLSWVGLELFIYCFKGLPIFELIVYFKFQIDELVNDSGDGLKMELNLHPSVY
jgi:hypothetical protein